MTKKYDQPWCRAVMFTLLPVITLPWIAVFMQPSIANSAAVTASEKKQRTEKLDRLFAALKTETDPAVGRRLVYQIWLNWHQSGNRKIDDLLSRAVINIGEGEYAAALTKFNEVIQRAPDFAEGWNRRATLFFKMGMYKRSLSDIAETLKREPRHFGALAGRGSIYAIQGRIAEALMTFEEAIKINPFLIGRKRIIQDLRKKLDDRRI